MSPWYAAKLETEADETSEQLDAKQSRIKSSLFFYLVHTEGFSLANLGDLKPCFSI